MDWFKTVKGVCQGCILSSCLFNLYAEYLTRNAGLDESQAGIKIAAGNINNLRYADESFLKLTQDIYFIYEAQMSWVHFLHHD